MGKHRRGENAVGANGKETKHPVWGVDVTPSKLLMSEPLMRGGGSV